MATTQNTSRIGFIGAGRAGRTLAAAFSQAGETVVAVFSRSAASAALLHAEVPSARVCPSAEDLANRCDVVFLTVIDDAIAPVCRSVAWRSDHRVIHCSGATEVSALDAARSAGAATGGFHPMQMFANPEVALAGLPGCTVGIEADPRLLPELEALARRIGCRPFILPAGVRALYHASANYVGPFLIALLQEALDLWKSFGATDREALEALVPLLRGTVSAVLDGGLARGMGGCVARGDVGTIVRHLAALDARSPEAGQLYRALTLRNIPLGLERGTLTAERAAAIEAVLMEAPREHAAGPAASPHARHD